MERIRTLLVVAVLALAGATAGGCSTDDAARNDAEDAAKDADKAAGNNDEKVAKESKEAGNDAVDAIDDDDGK